MGVLLRDLFSRNGARHAVVCRVDSVDLARKRFAKHHAEQHTMEGPPDTKSTDNAHDRFKAPVVSEVNDNVPTSAHLALCPAQHPQSQGSNSSLSSCPSSDQGTTNRIDCHVDHPDAMSCCPSEPQLPLPQPAAATQADSTTQTVSPPARARQTAVLPGLARVLSDVDIGRPSVAHGSSDRSESPRLDLASRPDSLILAKTRWAKAGLEAKAQGRSRSERQSCTNGGHSSARASVDHPGPAALRSKSSMAERAAALLPLALLSSRHSAELDRHHPGEIRGRRSSGVSRGASPTRPGHLLTSSGSQVTGPAGRLAHATSLPAAILTRDTSPPSAHTRPGVLERLKALLLSGPSDQSATQPRHRTNTHGADGSQHTLPSARQRSSPRRGDSTTDRDPAAVAASLQGCSTYEAEGPRDSSHALCEEFNAQRSTTASPCAAVFTYLETERTSAPAQS